MKFTTLVDTIYGKSTHIHIIIFENMQEEEIVYGLSIYHRTEQLTTVVLFS